MEAIQGRRVPSVPVCGLSKSWKNTGARVGKACLITSVPFSWDNLRSADQGARQYRYGYDANNRLTAITNPAGQNQITLGYDVRGNITGKTTSAGTQTLVFDHGNRLSYVAGQQYYRYDGQGRRVQTWSSSTAGDLFVYSQGGLLMQTLRPDRGIEYIYLGNTQVAQRSWAQATGWTTTYQHTDSLGSIVAETNQAGAINNRFAYAPYGENNGVDGVGYAGHVMDQMTGFTYMQQRYYDPVIGRFLSVDPVAANFNRYRYANDNPYRFVDPDGRNSRAADEGLSWRAAKSFITSIMGGDLQSEHTGTREISNGAANSLKRGIDGAPAAMKRDVQDTQNAVSEGASSIVRTARGALPDQVKAQGGNYLVCGSLTVDRYGKVYASLGINADIRKLFSAGMFRHSGTSVSAGWVRGQDIPDPDLLYDINTGPSIGAGFATPAGGLEIEHSPGTGTVIYGSAGANVTVNFGDSGGTHVLTLPFGW